MSAPPWSSAGLPPSLAPSHPPRRTTSPWLSLGLFLATCGSVLATGYAVWSEAPVGFAVALMGILAAHEAGHWVAARAHGVPASLPLFIPLPPVAGLALSPFGTLGAVILMDRPVRRRTALLDVAVAGPLAGLAVALPVLWLGLSLSRVEPIPLGAAYIEEGQSVAYALMIYLVHGPIPAGHVVMTHPIAMAGWAGLLVTFLNLTPLGQLDGGHTLSALTSGAAGRWIRRVALAAPLVLLSYNAAWLAAALSPAAAARGVGATLVGHAQTVLSATGNWIVLALLLWLLVRRSDAGRVVDAEPRLGPWRQALGAATLALWPLLLPPSPYVAYTCDAGAPTQVPWCVSDGP